MRSSLEEYRYAVVSGRTVKLDENRSNTVQSMKSLMEHKLFIKDETVPVILKYTRTVYVRESQKITWGMGF